ncbi:MAG: class I SAM-dependent methyltransferase family protein [Candidatus Hydrothermarchaeaceae archaeon]
MSVGVRVRAREAERTKKKLIELTVLDKEKKVKREEGYVLFPVLRAVEGLEEVDTEFETQERKDFKDLLSEFLTREDMEKVRSSFDAIGDIAILEVPEELEKWGPRIGESLLEAHKHIKAIYKKSGEVKGEERIRELVHLAGAKRTVTLHREHGCFFKIDVSKAYFSPRLSYERQRVLELTRGGEVVVDMFAGVGPFAVLLAKYRDVNVYAIDINPQAYELLRENVRLNKVTDKVTPLFGEARALAPRGAADRVIMNLPMKADQYLDVAMDIIKDGTIHFYAVSHEEDLFDSWVKFARRVGEKKGRKVEIRGTRIVRPYAPRRYHVALDIGVLS